MKRGTESHPKTLRLANLLNVELAAAIGILHLLWAHASDYAPRGDIGRWTDLEIALSVRRGVPVTEESAADLVRALLAAGWLDECPEHRLLIHDWPEHCEAYVHNRLARGRHRFADGSTPRLGRLPKLEQDTILEDYLEEEGINPGEQQGLPLSDAAKPAKPGVKPSILREWFEAFWVAYPRKRDKRRAQEFWVKKVKPDAALYRQIMDAVAAQSDGCQLAVAHPDDLTYIPYPATWLNGRRWEDALEPKSSAATQPPDQEGILLSREVTDEDIHAALGTD